LHAVQENAAELIIPLLAGHADDGRSAEISPHGSGSHVGDVEQGGVIGSDASVSQLKFEEEEAAPQVRRVR